MGGARDATTTTAITPLAASLPASHPPAISHQPTSSHHHPRPELHRPSHRVIAAAALATSIGHVDTFAHPPLMRFICAVCRPVANTLLSAVLCASSSCSLLVRGYSRGTESPPT